ncbi:hypothetical protein Q648_00507 [Bartonella quintana JK 12]|uniref:Uncharacterized protein n=2 Tax=Bartonella quintana TaxID=803 RepID=W3TX07_BARQI|nr:hypothetical protein Q651_01024 [Bartonella quintana BQ2-D70]ETS14288.1 hypothetical protein Q650_00920 [Bartonella quintana JK 73rel]ETS15975.1 hypothetical protein Q649_00929 [Bartonella quintana JK 73]ETS17978.1 hypothetical protein Q647_00918 [Bartonella quintana JK 7]ETS18807.1 hypothetical protein Q648_00507 [Bartonella quintana JK 12]KEC60205.1 hypothetical protein O93_00342 [Bartonella quintana JK 19]KEC60699.1 hypothetical protein O91_01290 [Bartonella quintana JK 31]KEC61616.1 h
MEFLDKKVMKDFYLLQNAYYILRSRFSASLEVILKQMKNVHFKFWKIV